MTRQLRNAGIFMLFQDKNQTSDLIIIKGPQNGWGCSAGHLVQTPCSSRVTYSRLFRTVSRQLL